MSVTFDAAPWSGKLPREADAALPLLVPRGSTAQTPAPRFAFDLAFARRFGVLLKNFLASSPWHWLGILSLVLCSILYSAVSSKVGDFYGEFYQVVTTTHDTLEALWTVLYSLGLVMVAQAAVQTCVVASAKALAVHVRKSMTARLHELYYHEKLPFLISQVQEMKNPDQQLTQDIDRFAKSYSDVLQKVIASPVFIVFFWVRVSYLLHWTAPLLILGYYFLTYIVQKFVMSPIVHHVYLQEKLEGEFRRVHSMQNEYAEAIALYRGERVEESISGKVFERVIANATLIVKWEVFLQFLSYLFSYLGTLVGYVVIALPLFLHASTALESNYVTTGLYDLGMLSWGFTQLTLVSSDLSEFAGYCTRIALIFDKLSEFDHKEEGNGGNDDNGQSNVNINGEEEVRGVRVQRPPSSPGAPLEVRCEHLTIFSPNGEVLIKDASLDLQSSVLVTGVAGSGKTSLLRVLAGIWPTFTGKDSYLPLATLKQQITYPKRYPDESGTLSRSYVDSLLATVGLEALKKLGDLSEVIDWNFLSPGQRQKMIMARLLHHSPRLAIVDEISSNVDPATERRFYEACRTKGIVLLSIGHRDSLVQFHDQVLQLEDCSLRPLRSPLSTLSSLSAISPSISSSDIVASQNSSPVPSPSPSESSASTRL